MDNEDRYRSAADSAEANGNDETTRSYPDVPPREALIARPDQRSTTRLTPKCIVKDYLYANVAQLISPGKTGKTTLELWEAIHIVLGWALYGLEVV